MRQLKIQTIPTFRDTTIEKYLNEISRIPTISPNEEVELAQKIRKGGLEGKRAKDKLVSANLRFVVSVAKQYQNYGLPLLDLINEGNIGLITAAEKFDETRGFKFISYAVWWIRQSILQAITEHGSIVRLPMNRANLLNKIEHAKNDFEQANQRKPSISELSAILNIEEDELQLIMTADKHHSSIDAPLIDGEDVSIGDTLQGDEATDEQMNKESLSTALTLVLQEVLTEREIKILRTYYGMDGQVRSYEEIASLHGLSRERVRQIVNKSIEKIKACYGSDLLKQYLN